MQIACPSGNGGVWKKGGQELVGIKDSCHAPKQWPPTEQGWPDNAATK